MYRIQMSNIIVGLIVCFVVCVLLCLLGIGLNSLPKTAPQKYSDGQIVYHKVDARRGIIHEYWRGSELYDVRFATTSNKYKYIYVSVSCRENELSLEPINLQQSVEKESGDEEQTGTGTRVDREG